MPTVAVAATRSPSRNDNYTARRFSSIYDDSSIRLNLERCDAPSGNTAAVPAV